MATAYWTVATITFAIILSAFLRDQAARKANGKAWAFIAIATLLWPITLPFISSSKIRTAKAHRQLAEQAASKESAAVLNQLQTASVTSES